MPQRNPAIEQAYATGGYSMKQIAQAFGVHYAIVSRAPLPKTALVLAMSFSVVAMDEV